MMNAFKSRFYFFTHVAITHSRLIRIVINTLFNFGWPKQ